MNTCATLTPPLSLSEGEGAVSIPSPVMGGAPIGPSEMTSEGEGAVSIPSPPEGERVG